MSTAIPDILARYAAASSPVPMATGPDMGMPPVTPVNFDFSQLPQVQSGAPASVPSVDLPPPSGVPQAPADYQQPGAGPVTPSAAGSQPKPFFADAPDTANNQKSWADYITNIAGSPEQTAMLIAIGTALSSTRWRNPQEALTGSFITGLAALGSVYKAQQDRLQTESKMKTDEERARATTTQAEAARTTAQTGVAREQREGRQGDAEIEIRKQNSATESAKTQGQLRYWQAQIDQMDDARAKEAAKLIMDQVSKEIAAAYAANPGETPDPAALKKVSDAAFARAVPQLSALGVKIPGSKDPGLEEEMQRVRALNPGAKEEDVRAAALESLKRRKTQKGATGNY